MWYQSSSRIQCKNVNLNDGTELHIHMANNRGRGYDNVTLTRVKIGTNRPKFTRGYSDSDIIAQTRTSGWKGKVNFSLRVKSDLNI